MGRAWTGHEVREVEVLVALARAGVPPHSSHDDLSADFLTRSREAWAARRDLRSRLREVSEDVLCEIEMSRRAARVGDGVVLHDLAAAEMARRRTL